jgi:hypothetical protein
MMMRRCSVRAICLEPSTMLRPFVLLDSLLPGSSALFAGIGTIASMRMGRVKVREIEVQYRP